MPTRAEEFSFKILHKRAAIIVTAAIVVTWTRIVDGLIWFNTRGRTCGHRYFWPLLRSILRTFPRPHRKAWDRR